MKILITLGSLALAALTTATATQAANIWRDKLGIYVKGDIVEGDYNTFKRFAANAPRGTTVVLNSDGGELINGLQMGIEIRTRQFRTLSVDTCASACAYMWLAGVERAAMSDSEIGFHGAADVSKKTGAVSVSGSGNALLGAYLARLGFSYTLIDMLTDAAPDEMNWLDFTKAKQVGITMRVYKSAAKQAAPPLASPVVPFLKKDKADVVNIP